MIIFYAGKNVEALFTRPAAVAFESAIQSEVSSQQEQKSSSIGPVNIAMKDVTITMIWPEVSYDSNTHFKRM